MTHERRLLILNERDPEHPRAGGAEAHVAAIFSRLASRGHQVRQLSVGSRGAPARTRLQGIEIERVRGLPRYYASIPGRLRRASRRDEFDLVVECLNKLPFYAPLFAAPPVLVLCHHLFGEVAYEQVARPIAAGVRFAERGLPLAYRHARFVAISESSREDLIARGLPADRIRVSYPGADPARHPVDLETPRPRRITILGRLEAYKRVDVALRASRLVADRFPDLEVLVIGRGSERSRLEALATRLGLGERTRFLGFVPDEERDALLAATRVCAFPSAKEGWGLTVIEANAVGTPVVASDVPGLRDSVRHEETGLLVPLGDPEALAAALARLLEDSEFARSTRRHALEWSRRFDWERAADEVEDAIEVTLREAAR